MFFRNYEEGKEEKLVNQISGFCWWMVEFEHVGRVFFFFFLFLNQEEGSVELSFFFSLCKITMSPGQISIGLADQISVF